MSIEQEAPHRPETDPDDEDAGVPAELLAERNALAPRLADLEARIAAARLARLTAEPRCPDCGAGVLRPKCLFELGLGCPRHELVNRYGGVGAMRRHLQSPRDAASPGASGDPAAGKGED